MAKREVKKGDAVNVVLADGTFAAAEVTGVKNGLANLLFNHNGQEIEITGSPCDETCRRADSWHFAAAEKELYDDLTDGQIGALLETNGAAIASAVPDFKPPANRREAIALLKAAKIVPAPPAAPAA